MNAIEIKGLCKSFGQKQAVSGLDMTVPEGAIYGFIGENGSGKSTTEKMICGLLVPNGGSIKLFGKDYKDAEVRSKIGVLIESPGCFPDCSVWNNPKEQISKALKLVRMEGAASNKFKNCSLGMKQRIGIAFALLGDPRLLILDEPINGLDADGMRIMRNVLTDVANTRGCTVVISSHILGELEKIATHYGIIRGGKMIKEFTAAELDGECRTFVSLKATDATAALAILSRSCERAVPSEVDDRIRIYDIVKPEDIVRRLYENGIGVEELATEKIGLEEYYIDLMKEAR